ncbi:MAG: hypothetical protein QOF89_4357 [Acidobacteriota bacterium]|jgi:hypothetical protein|nr:hypothetical protein [Acidobacteriota bacterium]
MSTIHNTAAFFLITVTLGSGIAMAQPPPRTKGAPESASFVQVKELGTARVMLSLAGPKYVVNEGLAGAAELPWRGDAACGLRLKTFSVEHPDGESGTKTISQSLAKTARGIHGTRSLQSFPLELLRNRCLDIANVPPGKPFKTAVDSPKESGHS